MPLGAFRINSLARRQVVAVASRTAKTITAIGDAQVDTAQSKYGGASALFDTSGDYLNVDYVLDLGLTTEWTVEFWVRPTASSLAFPIIGNAQSDTNAGYQIRMSSIGISNFLQFMGNIGSNGTAIASVNSSANALVLDTWNHCAVTMTGGGGTGIRAIYTNGNRVHHNTSAYALIASNVDTKIGGFWHTDAGTNWSITNTTDSINAHIDELRISNIVRYTGSTYTPPTAPFVNDANTLLLLHMDGTDGSTVFTDDNG